MAAKILMQKVVTIEKNSCSMIQSISPELKSLSCGTTGSKLGILGYGIFRFVVIVATC